MYVQAVDNWFYQNPFVSLVDGVCLHFKNEPELLITKRDNARKIAISVLKQFGVNFRPKMVGFGDRRALPPDWKMRDVYVFDGQLLAPIPVPMQADARVKNCRWDDKVIGFSSEFDTVDVVDTVLGDLCLELVTVLIKGNSYEKDDNKLKAEVAKKLYAQHPFLRSVTKDNRDAVIQMHPEPLRITWRQFG